MHGYNNGMMVNTTYQDTRFHITPEIRPSGWWVFGFFSKPSLFLSTIPPPGTSFSSINHFFGRVIRPSTENRTVSQRWVRVGRVPDKTEEKLRQQAWPTWAHRAEREKPMSSQWPSLAQCSARCHGGGFFYVYARVLGKYYVSTRTWPPCANPEWNQFLWKRSTVCITWVRARDLHVPTLNKTGFC